MGLYNNNKKIMIDARVVGEHYNHGIACYAYEIIYNLIHKYNDLSCFFFILVNRNSCLLKLSLPKNMVFIQLKTSWNSLLGQFELLKIIYKYKPNLFHSPSFIVPLLSRVKLIATIHDMNHVALAKNYSFIQKLYYILLSFRLRYRSVILTVSQFSKNEIIKYMEIFPSSIHVIYNGISPVFKPKNFYSSNNLETVRKKYNLPEKYIFAVGNNKPHKNLESLLEAYCKNNFILPLVILSKTSEKMLNIVKKYNKASFVTLVEHVEQQLELALIYAHCDLFVFPSLYEGFGFPPLEAAACGVPVLTSNISSLPEIMGQCAFYFDPYSVESIECEIKAFMEIDEKIKFEKVNNGLQLVKKFDWRLATEQTVAIYKKFNSLT